MTTTLQLPVELEKQFDEELSTLNVTHIPIRVKKNGEVMQNAGAYVKHFLAQALEDQKEGFVREVEMMELSGRGEEYRLAQDHIIDILKGKTK